MKIGVSPLERAFEIARSGRVASVGDIKTALRGEGYSLAELEGRSISKQLRDIIKAARATAPDAIPVEDLNASNDE